MRTTLMAAMIAIANPSNVQAETLVNEGTSAGTAASSTETRASDAPSIALPTTAHERLLSLSEAKEHYRGEHAHVVLEFLIVMDRVVNMDKSPPITPADWAPLGQLVDQEKFRRVGNYGVRNDWTSYSELLTQWANFSWWKGYIWRLREVPASEGKPALVYLESQERSNQKHPVRDDGDYSTLASIAVYEFGSDKKITALHVYDQRPL